MEKLVNWSRKSSFWGATFGLACCAIEMMAAGGPHYDLGRWGMEVFRASPRQADLMIVAGRVSQKMAPVLRQIYDQMAEPRWVLSMGVCASSGGMFNNYAIVQGVDHIVPVDMYLPGCPPRPEMLIDAILKLREKIMHEPLGPNGRKMLEARQARGDVPVVAVRRDAVVVPQRQGPARRVEKAVREGREEQLRIENWMKAQNHLPDGRSEDAGEPVVASAKVASNDRASPATSEKPGGGVPVAATPVGASSTAPAEYPPASPAGRGMFGVQGTGDTSGFGGLVRQRSAVEEAPRARTAATSTRSATRWRRRTRPSTTRSRRSWSTGAS